jgi:hypothetical protein
MNHNFTYKLVDRVNPELLKDLKRLVVKGPFMRSRDFQEYTLTVTPLTHPDPAIIDLLDYHMSKFFSLDGHIETNVAKMVPGGYVPEHSDFIANTYGSRQASIIKFQIPIITNPGCGLMWRFDDNETGAEALFLEEGGIYMFDNVRVHSSVNLGKTDRYWLTSRWKVESLIDKSILE